MNQRILDLADQAAEGVPGAHMNIPDEFCTKFAELIVKECMFQIKEEHNLKSNGTGPVGPYAHGFDDGMFVAINTIKEHFGVEE